MNCRFGLPRRTLVQTALIATLLGSAGIASAGRSYSLEERLQCAEAVVEALIPITGVRASDEEVWRRRGALPARIWRRGQKRAQLFPVAGADVKLDQIAWWSHMPAAYDGAVGKARARGQIRVLLFLRRRADGMWRYTLRSVNGFPSDHFPKHYAETVSAARRLWPTVAKSGEEGCHESG